MSSNAKFFVGLSVLTLSVLAAVGWWVRGALQGVPDFYHEAVEREVELAEKSSDEFLQQAAGVASDVRHEGRWEAVFTADQVNGWLAVDMPRNHPDLLPKTLSDPRIAIASGDITLACKYDGPDVQTVLTISCDAYLSAPNVVAIRIKGAHAGMMPLPLGKVLEAVTHAAQQMEIPLEWRRTGGDPVALLSLGLLQHSLSAHRHVELETIEFRDSEVYVAGHTGRGAVASAPSGATAQGDEDGQPSTTAAAVTVADARANAAGQSQAESPATAENKPASTSESSADTAAPDQPLIATPAEKETIQR